MKTQRAFAIRISNLLLEKNMTQYQLSKKMLTSQSTIKNILDESYNDIKFNTIVKIADAFDMTVQEFLNDKIFDRINLDVD